MPWHIVQCFRITCRTGPLGGCTLGRVGLLPNCAAKCGSAAATKSTPPQRTQRTRRNWLPDRAALCVLRVLCGGELLSVLSTLTRSPAAAAVQCSSRFSPAGCRRDAGGSAACSTCAACCRGTPGGGSP